MKREADKERKTEKRKRRNRESKINSGVREKSRCTCNELMAERLTGR